MPFARLPCSAHLTRRTRSARPLCISLSALALLASQSACTTANLKRMTYEMLAQEDCLRNQLDDFCTRGYTHEYKEYERVRLDYLRDVAEESANDDAVTP